MPDNDPKLMTVFAEALERTDPAARAAYLDDACRGDAALRRRVEALLAAHAGAGRFLEPDSPAMSETSRTRNPGGAAALTSETRPRSQQATERTRAGRRDRPRLRPPRRPTALADSSRARSSPAGTRCSMCSVKEGWAPSTGRIRPTRSSGRWR